MFETEESKNELAKFISFKNSRLFSIIDIIKQKVDDRTENSQFYLQLYILT